MPASSERFCVPSSASRDIVSPSGTCFLRRARSALRRAGRDGSRASVAATRSSSARSSLAS